MRAGAVVDDVTTLSEDGYIATASGVVYVATDGDSLARGCVT